MKPAIRASFFIVVLTALVSCATTSDVFRSYFMASRAYCLHAPTVEAIVVPLLSDSGSDDASD